MSKFGRKIAAASTASALAVVALSACAQETPDTVYDSQATDNQATDTRETEYAMDDQTSAMDNQSTTRDYQTSTDNQTSVTANTKDEARQMATTLGVSELNDIENWKVTNAGEELGEIDRLGIDRSTGEILAVVGLEGVVGVNMKEVAIPLKKLQHAGDETLSTDLTKDELQQKRDIDPWDDTYSQVTDENATQ